MAFSLLLVGSVTNVDEMIMGSPKDKALARLLTRIRASYLEGENVRPRLDYSRYSLIASHA